MYSLSPRHVFWSLSATILLLGGILYGPAGAASYYLSPSGSNVAAGTSSATPWQTFGFAIPRLNPGDTLFLLDGTYTTAHAGGTVTGSTDVVSVKCGTNAANGTAATPITLKAVNERQAKIQSSGRTAVYLMSCSYWVVEGLYTNVPDVNPGSGYDGTAIVLDLADHVTLRRNLVYGANAWWNSHGIALYNTNNSLVEENEVYYVTRHGIIQAWNSTGNTPSGNTLRRNYVHSRDHDTMPGGYTCSGSCENSTGDEGISCYPCNTATFENNIVEHWWSGFSVQAKAQTYDNHYLGNIALTTGEYGSFGMTARADSQQNTADQMPTNITFINNLVVNGTGMGCRTCKNWQLTNNTVLNSTGGFASDDSCGIPCGEGGDGHLTTFGRNLLVVGSTVDNAFVIESLESYAFDYVRVYNSVGTGFDGNFTHTSTSDPNLGTCKVFIPTSSNLKGAGLAGADIGANILFRYENRVLTTTPLWDPTTNRFPCGAIVAGVNDLAGSSCFDVHTRLNVNTNGCALPSTGSLPIPANLRLTP